MAVRVLHDDVGCGNVLDPETGQVADGQLIGGRSARIPSGADLPELDGVFGADQSCRNRVLQLAEARALAP